MWTTMWTRAHTPYFNYAVFTAVIVNQLKGVVYHTILFWRYTCKNGFLVYSEIA